MKCLACGEDFVHRELAYCELCIPCYGARRKFTDAAGEQWDREHREPKEIVIEVEVPSGWRTEVMRAMRTAGHMVKIHEDCIHFTNGRLVLKARKETP